MMNRTTHRRLSYHHRDESEEARRTYSKAIIPSQLSTHLSKAEGVFLQRRDVQAVIKGVTSTVNVGGGTVLSTHEEQDQKPAEFNKQLAG